MKTKIIISVVALSLVLITKSTFAKNQTLSGTPKQEAKTATTQVREEKKNTLSELKLKKVETISKGIKMGLVKRYEALEKIKAKLDARIDKNPVKMKRDQASINTIKSTLNEDFNSAKANYVQHMSELETQFNNLNSSAKPSEVVKSLKVSVDLVREDLNTMKKVLTTAVTALAQAPKSEVNKNN